MASLLLSWHHQGICNETKGFASKVAQSWGQQVSGGCSWGPCPRAGKLDVATNEGLGNFPHGTLHRASWPFSAYGFWSIIIGGLDSSFKASFDLSLNVPEYHIYDTLLLSKSPRPPLFQRDNIQTVPLNGQNNKEFLVIFNLSSTPLIFIYFSLIFSFLTFSLDYRFLQLYFPDLQLTFNNNFFFC